MSESSPKKENQEMIESGWNRLQRLLPYLESLGLQTHTFSYDHFRDFIVGQGMPEPIASGGADGVRISYDRSRGLMLWFTNEFEDPENETRKIIKAYWDGLE